MTYERYTGNNGHGRTPSDPDQIQSDLRDIRGELGSTLDALASRLRPEELIHQAVLSARSSGGAEFMRNLSRTLQDNPVPVIMIAAGMGYLAYTDSLRRRGGQGPESQDLEGGVEGRAGGARQRIGEAAGAARERAGAARERLTERVAGARAGAAESYQRVSMRATHVRQRGQRLVQEQPLVLAGLGLALGAAIAGSAPVSRSERRLAGASSQRAAARAREMARGATQHATEVAGAAAEAGLEEANRQLEQRLGSRSGSPEPGPQEPGPEVPARSAPTESAGRGPSGERGG